MTNFLPTDGVLLVGEEETGEGGITDVIEGGDGGIKNAKANGKFDITEAERGTERIGGGGLSVFTGTVKEKEGNVGHVNHSAGKGGRVEDGEGMAVVNEAERSRGYALRGRVSAPPTSKLLAKAVVKSFGGDETAIRGPQAGHRLANGTEGVLHCSRSDWETILGKAAVAVALCKDL